MSKTGPGAPVAWHLALMRLYPAYWRKRYGDEFAALLEECGPTPLSVVDIILGALDAHLHPRDMTGRLLHMDTRRRRAALVIFGAYIAFVLAGLGFQKMTEYDDFTEVARAHPLVGGAFNAVLVGAMVALLAVLAGGIPIAWAALRFAWRNRRWNVLALFCVPPLSLALILGWTFVLHNVIYPRVGALTISDPRGLALGLSWFGLFGLAAIASTAAVSLAVTRSEIPPRLYTFALWPAVAATVAMGATCLAVIIWGIGLYAGAPDLFGGNGGIMETSTSLSWTLQVVVMAICVGTAIVTLARTGRTWRAQRAAPAV